jgi:hypothetical protein
MRIFDGAGKSVEVHRCTTKRKATKGMKERRKEGRKE